MPRICIALLLLVFLVPATVSAQISPKIVQLQAEDLMTRDQYLQHLKRLKECKTQEEINSYLEEHQQLLIERAKALGNQNNGSPEPAFYRGKRDSEFIRHD